MPFFGKCLHCSSLVMAVLIAMFVGSICLPTQLPILQIDEGGSAPEAQDELKLKHVTNPSIQARKYSVTMAVVMLSISLEIMFS